MGQDAPPVAKHGHQQEKAFAASTAAVTGEDKRTINRHIARAFASKAAEQAARIAGVITLFNDPGALEVGESAMDGAMRVMNFYLGEHLRLMGTGKQEQGDARLRSLLEWMQSQGHIVSNADVQQKCPRLVRKLKTKGIKLLLEELKERGYIRPIGKAWEIRHGV